VFAECHLYGQRSKICSVLVGRHLIEWRTGGACATRAGFFSSIFFPETEALFLRIFPFFQRFRWWCVLVRRLLFNSCFAWFASIFLSATHLFISSTRHLSIPTSTAARVLNSLQLGDCHFWNLHQSTSTSIILP
jgi:hypothetical protein